MRGLQISRENRLPYVQFVGLQFNVSGSREPRCLVGTNYLFFSLLFSICFLRLSGRISVQTSSPFDLKRVVKVVVKKINPIIWHCFVVLGNLDAPAASC